MFYLLGSIMNPGFIELVLKHDDLSGWEKNKLMKS